MLRCTSLLRQSQSRSQRPAPDALQKKRKAPPTRTCQQSFLSDVTETEANRALLVRYLRSLNLRDTDVRAVWPEQSMQVKEGVKEEKTRAARQRTIVGNQFLSTGGKSSKEKWLSRVVVGFTGRHNYNAHLFNERKIMMVHVARPAETELQAMERERALAGLRPILIRKVAPLCRT